MSFRTLARSAPRTLSRLSTAAVQRTSPSVLCIQRATATSLRLPQSSAFSTSLFRRAPAISDVDEELSAKLDSEIQFETEVKDNEPQPASVKDFLDTGLFEIEDIPGQEEVVLKRTYGNEKYV